MRLWSSARSSVSWGALCAILVGTGCAADPAEPVDDYVPEPAPQMPRSTLDRARLPAQAFEDRSGAPAAPGYAEEHVEEIAQFDLAVFTLRFLLTDAGASLADALRLRNPNIVILGVLQVLSVPEFWGETWNKEHYPLTGDLYDLWWPHQATTTAGTTAYMWDKAPMVNPYRKKSFDLSLLRAHVDIIARHAMQYPRAFDGIFHDYMSPAPWLYPDGPSDTFDADLDGDGVGFRNDPDETQAWVGWQRELLRELQARFGDGLIQVVNGYLPFADDEVASLCAGIVFQNFPSMVFNWTDRQGLERLLEQMESKLTPRRGHFWNILEAETATRIGDVQFRRVASMLTEQFYVYRSSLTDTFFGLDPDPIDAGAPIGPVVRTDLEDGSVNFERAFENGIAVIYLNDAGTATWVGVQPN